MSEKLKVLLVEDSEPDAELVLRELRQAGFTPESQRVDTAPALRRALLEMRPQIVLSDFSMPDFDGLSALRICREWNDDVPFIFLSGTVGEDVAVDAMRAGANDYVMKGKLAKLGPALRRELREARSRRDRWIAEVALRRAQTMASLAHVITAPDGSFESWSDTLPRLAGIEPARMPQSIRAWMALIEPDDRERFRTVCIRAAKALVREYVEYRLGRPDGSVIQVRQVMEPLQEQSDLRGKLRWFSTIQDITEQRRSEDELRRFRLAMDSSGDIIILIDRASMRHVDVNATACRLLGYSREELLAMGPTDILPVSREELERTYDDLIDKPGTPSGMRSHYRRKDGSLLPFESTRRVFPAGERWLIVAISRDIRERIAQENALRESESRFRSLTALSSDWYWEQDAELRFSRFEGRGTVMSGYEPNRAIGKKRWELNYFGMTDDDWKTHRADLEARRTFHDLELRTVDAEGRDLWVSVSGEPIFDAARRFVGYRGVGKNITPKKQAERRISQLARVYAVLSGINALIVRVKDSDELFREACRIAVQAGRFRMAWIGTYDADRQTVSLAACEGHDEGFLDLIALAMKAPVPEGRGLVRRAIREKRPVIINDIEHDAKFRLRSQALARGYRAGVVLPLLVAGEVTGVLGLFAAEPRLFDRDEMRLLTELAGDIAFALEHLAKARQVDYLAYYDSLTGLANRALFLERLAQILNDPARKSGAVALVLFDIERFKTVNDSLGRQAGDELLRRIALRIRTHVPDAQARIARIGADHFAILVPGVESPAELAREHEKRMREFFGEPFHVADTMLRMSARAGIALFPEDGDGAEALFLHAEAALKKAKASGEAYLFFAREMTERIGERLKLETKLREALEKDEFVLHYQPKVDSQSGQIVGVEALIRWQSPEMGLVPPLQFIPLMEETGLILRVGSWALQRAVSDHRTWCEQKLNAPRVAVNVSAIQLRQRDFVTVVERALSHGVTPTCLDLEITESLIMHDVQANIGRLNALRAFGIRIAIDDFGTGYSSLAYLAKLPLETLKIDRVFIDALTDDANTITLVQTIISMAQSLKLKVVAEGVETEQQARMLRLLRCDQMQGYFFGKPLPAAAMTERLRRGS